MRAIARYGLAVSLRNWQSGDWVFYDLRFANTAMISQIEKRLLDV